MLVELSIGPTIELYRGPESSPLANCWSTMWQVSVDQRIQKKFFCVCVCENITKSSYKQSLTSEGALKSGSGLNKHHRKIINNNSPKWRWIAVDIYRAASPR